MHALLPADSPHTHGLRLAAWRSLGQQDEYLLIDVGQLQVRATTHGFQAVRGSTQRDILVTLLCDSLLSVLQAPSVMIAKNAILLGRRGSVISPA